MDPISIILTAIALILGMIGFGLSVFLTIFFLRTGRKNRVLLVLPAGVISITVLLRSFTILLQYL